MKEMAFESRIQTIGFLRGVAVLAVCCCHFSKAILNGTVLSQLFNWLLENGKYGVEIFFVISGFVIPYSLHRAGYGLKQYFKFLYKFINQSINYSEMGKLGAVIGLGLAYAGTARDVFIIILLSY